MNPVDSALECYQCATISSGLVNITERMFNQSIIETSSKNNCSSQFNSSIVNCNTSCIVAMIIGIDGMDDFMC
jgi:hypothetical protein